MNVFFRIITENFREDSIRQPGVWFEDGEVWKANDPANAFAITINELYHLKIVAQDLALQLWKLGNG